MSKKPDRYSRYGKHLNGGEPAADGALSVRLLLGRVGIAQTIEEIAAIVEEVREAGLAADLREAVRKYRERGELGTRPLEST